MKQRLLVAAVGVPLLIVVLVLLPPYATAILTAAIAGAAAWELLHTACRQPKLLYVPTVLCAALVVLAIAFGTAITATLIYAFFYVMFLFYMAVSTHGKENAIPFADAAICIVAGFLFPAMYSCIALLRNVSPAFVLMPFVIAFIGDSFSMLGGMAFGHKKFAPHVSPNKTWAGFLAGPVGSALGMVLLGLVSKWLWQMELPLWYLAVIGIAANLFGQLGDLSMSLIKREAGIKDYSHIFLTHGGVLDRFDSTLFLSPVVYAMLFLLEKLV
mgnify:FL=1